MYEAVARFWCQLNFATKIRVGAETAQLRVGEEHEARLAHLSLESTPQIGTVGHAHTFMLNTRT